MKTRFSEVSTIPMYSSSDERRHAWCDQRMPVLIYPSWTEFNVQFCFGDTDPSFVGISVFSETGNNVPTAFDYDVLSEDVNGDGNLKWFVRIKNIQWASGPSGTSFYLRISVDGGATDYYSEDFHICPATYKLDYWNDCSSEFFGSFESSWKNTVYLKDFAPERQANEEEVEARRNGYNVEQRIFYNIEPVYKGRVYGADYFYDTINYIKYFDNIQLTNIDTGEVWDLKNIIADNGTEQCAYSMGITFETGTLSRLACGTSAFENAPYDDPDVPPALDCTGFGVTIAEAAGVLSYSIQNNPNGALAITQYWTRDGQVIGTGSTVALTDFGVYGLVVRIGTCSATDTYDYLNACVMTTQVTVNGTTINAATSNAPAAVTYQLYNSAGTLVSSSLPYDVGVSGLFTLKTTSGTCQTLNQVQVNSETGSTDCSFTFDLTKNGSTLEVSNVSEASYSVEWLYSAMGGSLQSVGTGDTHAINGAGLYIARVTALGCAKDSMYVYLEPVQISGGDCPPKYHEADAVTGTNYDFTDFDLPNPHTHSEAEINAKLQVFVNQQKYTYKDTTADPEDYTITVSNTDNKIVPQIAFANDKIEIYYTP